MESMRKRDHLETIVPDPPKPGESIHIITNGKADFWTWIPHMVKWCGTVKELYCSTWTLNRTCCVELFELMDAGIIEKATFLTGLYFKRRETAVYATLLQGLQARNQRYVAFENHTKITLLRAKHTHHHLVAEGSANLTSNPRLEQVVLSDDPALYAFHRGWMEETLEHAT